MTDWIFEGRGGVDRQEVLIKGGGELKRAKDCIGIRGGCADEEVLNHQWHMRGGGNGGGIRDRGSLGDGRGQRDGGREGDGRREGESGSEGRGDGGRKVVIGYGLGKSTGDQGDDNKNNG